ncbi:Fe-Mn family superoxide dismutase [Piscinibacter sakaiensis]|uniref:Fe-Mn family superoxide dismutase n=1 Tax=Piscinibacter sakaiensis TaxID=1547922 RepID=UPI003AAE2819
MASPIRPLPFDPATVAGLSERLLLSHHANNYGGAVRRLDAIRAELAELPFASSPGYRINGLKREELMARNSVALHELYFASIAGGSEVPQIGPPMAVALAAGFGSVDRWREEFGAIGKALGGGSGWVLLVFDPREGKLVNQWASDHSQVLAGSAPLLALDMYEHAYHLDYGAAAAAYVDSFLTRVDWAQVHQRYRASLQAASEPFGIAIDGLADTDVIDVRRAGAYQASDSVIPGSVWRDPTAIADWGSTLAASRRVAVYCVHGHDLSQAAALRLRAAGVDAHYLRGGIEAWQAAGAPLQRRPD